jgi:exopolysaccharide biosynthesis polyprenyl glycosylphosphotransferase
MLRRFSLNYALFSIAVDAIWVAFALHLASRIAPQASPFLAPSIGRWASAPPAALVLVFPAVWTVFFLLFSVYDGRKNLRVSDELTGVTIASVLAGIFLAGGLFFTFQDFPRGVFVSSIGISYLGIIGWRLLARAGFTLAGENSATQRRVLIVGAGRLGLNLGKQITQNRGLGLIVAGYLDDNPEKRNLVCDYLGVVDEVISVVRAQKIDDVVMALPPNAYEKMNALVVRLHTLAVKVWIIPDYFQFALGQSSVEEFAGIPMFDLRAPVLNEYQRMVKRTFDLGITLILLLPALLVMGVIAIAIWLETRGPVIFRQQRVGENGRLFTMYKFNTMVRNAEKLRHIVEQLDEQGHILHKTKDDPRVTRVGKFLRRSSLDELPQVFNILAGNMSLVGPRPELPYLVQQYDLWQWQRFTVPQGLTGWWQVNGRSDKPMHLHTEDDLHYIKNYSILLDCFILLKTVWVVLIGKGAY